MGLSYHKGIPELLFSISFIGMLFFVPYSYNWSDNIYAVYSFCGVYGSVVLFLAIQLFSPGEMRLLRTDLAFCAFWVIVTLSAFNAHYVHGNEQLFTFSLFSAVYLVIRVYRIHYSIPILVLFLLAFLVELVMGICQVRHLVPFSNTFTLTLQGSLGNSGLYCCWIIVIFYPLAYASHYIRNKVFRVWIVSALFLLVITVLLLTKSRAGLCGFMVSLVLFRRIFGYLFAGLATRLNKRLSWKFMVAGVLCILSTAVLFKQRSATGRALIWDVSIPHVVERPLLGVGYGKFPVMYSGWQSTFFSAGKGSPGYREVADVNYEAFDEPLQVLLESGVAGLVSAGVLVFFLFRIDCDPSNRPELGCMKAAMTALLVFSLFSYPFHSTPLLFLAVSLLAMAGNLSTERPVLVVSGRFIQRGCRLTALLCSLGGAFVLFPAVTGLRQWIAIKQSSLIQDNGSAPVYAGVYGSLRDNGLFLFDYGQLLFFEGNYAECIKMLERSKAFYIDEKTYDYLGLCYQKMKQYDKAEACFTFLTNLMPNRFRPNYLLARLYYEMGDLREAKSLAVKILRMPVKIPSDEVNNIKIEMQQLITNNRL